MITIQFAAASHPELCSMLRNYLADMDGDVPTPAAPARLPAPEAAAEQTETKRRGRPAKAATAAPAPAEQPAVEEAAPEPTVEDVQAALDKIAAPTLDDVKNALAALSESNGIQAAREVCVEYQVASIKQLPAERYAEFIATCQQRAA